MHFTLFEIILIISISNGLIEKIFINFPLYPFCSNASNPLYAIPAAVPSYTIAKSFPLSLTIVDFPISGSPSNSTSGTTSLATLI